MLSSSAEDLVKVISIMEDKCRCCQVDNRWRNSSLLSLPRHSPEKKGHMHMQQPASLALFHGILEHLASSETGGGRCLQVNLLTGAGVPPLACTALTFLESSKSRDQHTLSYTGNDQWKSWYTLV